MQEMSLPNTTQFISLAATLLLVKSKSLLPVLELTEEEETSIEDLEERLKKYQIIRDASIAIQAAFGSKIMYAPQFSAPKEAIFMPDAYCSLLPLAEAIVGVINDLPKKEEPVKAKIKVIISLEEMMDKLKARITQNLHTRFSELHAGEKEKKVVIVGFLAILELFKQGNLIVNQHSRFSDIDIELDRGQTPTYY
jgi:segregation and condensation protein A